MKNQLLIASAGAGKTTYFVKEALACIRIYSLTKYKTWRVMI